MALLDEAEHREVLANYTTSQWAPLLDLIPEIEASSAFRRERNGWFVWEPIVNSFHSAVYEIPVVVSFDWSSWTAGKDMMRDDQFDFDLVDVPDKCKVISLIVRAERFNEGVLPNKFADGTILRILQSLQRAVQDRTE